ncbi:DUF6270 domain-containing protein [Brevibacillus sp. H7]|uniref:DUF6270 domain-containing protein n=1 Tax=Brevibacillus sp. H7 TaxID=3349138 RepID=UPI0037FB2020
MPNFFILGSCVTRDIFRVADIKCSIHYFARTSLISLVSNPIPINDDMLKLDSEFQKRMVLQDFHKNFFDELAKTSFDYLLLDFIDERFDLYRVIRSYITRSNELVNSKVMESSFKDFEQIRRQQETTHLLWEQACLTFIQKLTEIVSASKVILHEAYWSEQYWDHQELKHFPDNMLPGIKRMNDMLRRYHSFFKQNLPGIHVISGTSYGDSQHIWGLSPYHYHDEYYKTLYNQIHDIAL